MPPADLSRFTGVVAIDGPSGTGKSSATRFLARRLDARYLDTGAMYRAATVAVLRAGVELSDPAAITRAVAAAVVQISTDPEPARVSLDGADVSLDIRSAAVTDAVSAVSAVAAVRTQLVAQQRALIGAGGIVVEGRDIGTTVWPQAQLKVYLTAREDVRAARRAGELGTRDNAAVAASLRRRDQLDTSRVTSPLLRADGAVELDTSELTLDEVVDRLAQLVADASTEA